MPKGTSQAKVTSNIEKIKSSFIALAVIKLRLSEGISRSVSHKKVPFTNFFNLLKMFQADLKACLGLVIPNQYCLIIVRENRGWFLGDCYFVSLCGPYYTVQYCTIFFSTDLMLLHNPLANMHYSSLKSRCCIVVVIL